MKHEGKIRKELAEADDSIKDAETRIAQQRKRVADLSAGGHDTEEAEKLLARLVESLETLLQHRKTIFREVEGKD